MYASGHRPVDTASIDYDIFLCNHGKSAQNIKPLKLWDHSKEHLTPLITFTILAQDSADEVDELTVNFEVFSASSKNGRVPTKKLYRSSLEIAKSKRMLESTGKYEHTLPIAAKEASIYLFSQFFGNTIMLYIVYRDDGEYISELENPKLQHTDVIDGHPWFPALKDTFRDQGIRISVVARVALAKAKPLKTNAQKQEDSRLLELSGKRHLNKSTPPEPSTISIVDSDEELGNGDTSSPDNGERTAFEEPSRLKRQRSVDDDHTETVREYMVCFILLAGTDLEQTEKRQKALDSSPEDSEDKHATYFRHKLQKHLEGKESGEEQVKKLIDSLGHCEEQLSCIPARVLKSTHLRKVVEKITNCADTISKEGNIDQGIDRNVKDRCQSLLQRWKENETSCDAGSSRQSTQSPNADVDAAATVLVERAV